MQVVESSDAVKSESCQTHALPGVEVKARTAGRDGGSVPESWCSWVKGFPDTVGRWPLTPQVDE